MKIEELWDDVTDVVGARKKILHFIERNLKSNTLIIYFHGWSGFGATAVLRSIAQDLPSMKAPSPKLCFGKTIYVDCSFWKSKRVMQRKIAEELKLDQTMDMFDKQDEEDDFDGLDLGSRDVIPGVAALIDQTLRETRFMMIFINGSDKEIDLLRRIGIPEYSDSVIVWTFSTKRFMMKNYSSTMIKIADKLRYTDAFIVCYYSYYGAQILSSSQFIAVFHEEAANIVPRHPCLWGMDLRTVVDCCLYGFVLYHSFHSTTTGFVWPAHAPNYWICDEIIQGERAWEICNALHPEISFECDDDMLYNVFRQLEDDPDTHFLVVNDDDGVYHERPNWPDYRWVSVTMKNKKVHYGMQILFLKASSIFIAYETKGSPGALPDEIFIPCNNLGVLVLSSCAFSFVSPPFLNCHNLRFLGLDNCIDDHTIELEGRGCTAKWAFLESLRVIDLYYTGWVQILSNIELMDYLQELNIEGVRLSRWTIQHLQKRLPYLQRLRIIRPLYTSVETASSDIPDLFLGLDNTSPLEILDLSGSDRGMGRNLPASISKARHLQVLILDGCDGLEDVVISNNSSLRSFSFDGYGPASRRTTTVELPPVLSRPDHPLDAEKKSVVKATMVSLRGCTQLDNIFVRGLPNLEELDLSGCAIEVLDFRAMVVDVPRLKRLFLLGCENLRAIQWGSAYEHLLELIYINTLPVSRMHGYARPPSLSAYYKQFFLLHMHVVITDAKLIRSLWRPIWHAPSNVYFDISITSPAACNRALQRQPDRATASREVMIGSVGHQGNHVAAIACLYGDVVTKVGDGPAPMQAFPKAPAAQKWIGHIEISHGSHSVQGEVEVDPGGYNLHNGLGSLMTAYTQSLHVHDVLTCGGTLPATRWDSLRWCLIERCPNLSFVFPPGAEDWLGRLEIIWASHLLTARCVWSKGAVIRYSSIHRFNRLRHLHLRCCSSLRFGLAMDKRPSFPSLETLHIIHCGELRHIFVPGDEKNKHPSVEFPKLTTIHLHDLPALQQICEAEMLAPALETIKIRGCWSLRRLPALKGGNGLGKKRPSVQIEKDVWDTLEWDGVDVGHHPSLYEAPLHSRYYKRLMLRGTVLR